MMTYYLFPVACSIKRSYQISQAYSCSSDSFSSLVNSVQQQAQLPWQLMQGNQPEG